MSMMLSAPHPAVLAGRRTERKRQQIVQAAFRLFLSEGVARTSVDAVAQAAGVSKPTIYSHFATKEDLFTSTVREKADEFMSGVLPLNPAAGFRQELERFALGLGGVLQNEECAAFERMVSAEVLRHPELGRLVYVLGPARILEALAELLRAHATTGALDLDDPYEAAEHLMGMLFDAPCMRRRFCVEGNERHVDLGRIRRTIERFLRAYSAANKDGKNSTGEPVRRLRTHR